MDFSRRQADPRRHVTGIAVVILLHLIILYALVTGLAKKVVDVVRAPIETKVIEEIKKPPPPAEIVPPPPPKMEAPPPPYIPPPEVQIAAPPPAPTITAVTQAPPPTTVITPQAPPAAPAPAAPPAPPKAVTAAVACSNYSAVMGDASFPGEAKRKNLEHGTATIQFTLTAGGEVTDVKTLNASNPIFGRYSEQIVQKYKCAGQGQTITVTVPFSYKLE
ncbi:MAG: TonB family protein [Proteobacteria bacterium]|nr:TonB family protein [Pseudomonadota bacterium]